SWARCFLMMGRTRRRNRSSTRICGAFRTTAGHCTVWNAACWPSRRARRLARFTSVWNESGRAPTSVWLRWSLDWACVAGRLGIIREAGGIQLAQRTVITGDGTFHIANPPAGRVAIGPDTVGGAIVVHGGATAMCRQLPPCSFFIVVTAATATPLASPDTA